MDMSLVLGVDDLSVESGLPIGVIFDSAHIAIGLHQGVLSSDGVSITLLLLVLVISSVRIIHSVLESVLWMGVLSGDSEKGVSFFVIMT